MNFIRIYSNLRQLLLLLEIFSDKLLQQQKTPVQTFKWTYFGEGMSWISFFFSLNYKRRVNFPFLNLSWSTGGNCLWVANKKSILGELNFPTTLSLGNAKSFIHQSKYDTKETKNWKLKWNLKNVGSCRTKIL